MGAARATPRAPTPRTHKGKGEVALPHWLPVVTWVLRPHPVWVPSLEHHLHLLLVHPCTAACQAGYVGGDPL